MGSLLLLWFAGCAAKTYAVPQQALIVFKTPSLRYADQGFVQEGGKSVRVQIYGLGKPVLDLRVGKNICMDEECMDEQAFYREVFSTAYPPGTLLDILKQRPLADGKGMETDGGQSVQRIAEKGRFDIIYRFSGKQSLFKDSLNGVMIKIQKGLQ